MIEPPTDQELTAIHAHIENILVEMRDNRTSILGRANGLVVRERDGKPSQTIRIGTRQAVDIAVRKFLEIRGA